ncbi:hypothetical protein VT84_16640 [Gemmata sp. SH-PL17]|uniref:hypothetical protein n=1 Tax=Gemmata sp. SH-PL17 TaxID=1630693 RepID=UPI00078E7813|nr:hypothetical protein [Gemmata sp. SH-PL17]AMV26029.1 hypothetical protein VT84_16640 [Gemmata sp. SH-PL17]
MPLTRSIKYAHRKLWAYLVLVPFVFLLASCSDGRKKCYPISGKILVDGKPAADCFIYLYPANPADGEGKDRTIPLAVADENGAFALSTYGTGDGAPAGDYIVTFTWRERSGLLKNQYEGKDRLNGKYATVEKSPVRLTVEKKPTELPPFELTTK